MKDKRYIITDKECKTTHGRTEDLSGNLASTRKNILLWKNLDAIDGFSTLINLEDLVGLWSPVLLWWCQWSHLLASGEHSRFFQ